MRLRNHKNTFYNEFVKSWYTNYTYYIPKMYLPSLHFLLFMKQVMKLLYDKIYQVMFTHVILNTIKYNFLGLNILLFILL